jgi:D-inositol-3-phosphate glycosyltransferase
MCNDVPDFYQKAIRPRSIKSALSMPLYWFYYLYDRAQNRKIDLTMLLSNWVETEYKAVYSGPTQVVRSGADPDRFAPGGDRAKIRSRFGFSEGEFVLLWLGIFMPHRHLEDAIEAVARSTSNGLKVKLLLAGSDRSYPDYLRSLKQLALSRGLKDKVIFSGKVADEEIRDFYAACDAFLFPNDKQTWGLVVLEAMACGCLTIVSTGAGVHEVLTDGENSILFPPRDTAALTQKISWLLNSPQGRGRIASNGMKLVRERYNWDRFADQIEALCNRTPV